METNLNGVPNQEDLNNPQNESQLTDGNSIENSQELNASESGEEGAKSKRKHHDDHHINRKYRVFSNHSSYGDSPHTNTSF